VSTRAPAPRDAFAPGLLFSLAFAGTYAAPYLNLIDYSDTIPPPGARMASLAALGLLSYLAGLAVARRAWATPARARPPVEANEWRSPRALLTVTALALASLALFAAVLKLGAMVPLLAENKEAARWALTKKLGYPVNAVTRLPIPAAIACGLYVLASRRGLSMLNALASALILASMAALALLGHRGLPIFILVPLVICFHYLVRPLRLELLVAAGALIVVGLGVANYLRLSTSPPQLAHMLAHSKLPAWVPPSLTPAVTFVAFGPLTFNLVLSTVPEREPFQYGAAMFNGAFGILPGHQMTISEFVSRRLLLLPPDSPGLPPTILGGFYLDFGTVGIVVGMLLVGIVSQYLYWRMFERPSLWAVFFYAYWTFNLLVALYGDLIANDLIWFIPLAVYGIHVALGWTARTAPARTAGA
jgi:hypothetical protein